MCSLIYEARKYSFKDRKFPSFFLVIYWKEASSFLLNLLLPLFLVLYKLTVLFKVNFRVLWKSPCWVHSLVPDEFSAQALQKCALRTKAINIWLILYDQLLSHLHIPLFHPKSDTVRTLGDEGVGLLTVSVHQACLGGSCRLSEWSFMKRNSVCPPHYWCGLWLDARQGT